MTENLDRIRERLAGLETQRAMRGYELGALEQEVADLGIEEVLLAKVDEVLLEISSKVLGSSTSKIDALVTGGLRSVFEDQDLRFVTHVENFRGRTAVRFELLHGDIAAPIMDSYGGGVLAIAGVLLRVVTIMVLGLRRFVLLDESMAHVADDYIPNASKLLKRLHTELGFDILLVTHQPKFAEFADRHYEAKKRGGGTDFDERADSSDSSVQA